MTVVYKALQTKQGLQSSVSAAESLKSLKLIAVINFLL